MSDPTTPTGPQGPIGPQGLIGPSGADGATGARGPAGPAGKSSSDHASPGEPKTPQGYTATDLANSPTLSQHLLIGLYSSLSTMVSTITTFGEKVTLLTTATDNVNTKIELVDQQIKIVDDRRRRDRIVNALIFGVLTLVVFWNRQSLDILQDATGPTAQQRQAEATDFIRSQIRCDGEDNLRVTLQALADSGLPVAVPNTSPFCVGIREKEAAILAAQNEGE